MRHADHVATLYPLKLALTSPTSDGRFSAYFASGLRPRSLLLLLLLLVVVVVIVVVVVVIVKFLILGND
jgi:hypothetical protein